MPRKPTAKNPRKPTLSWFNEIPGYDPWKTREDCWFDKKHAEYVLEFFPRFLKHVQGKFAGKPVELRPWQKACIGHLFGWKRPDGSRRYRECLLYVPRKNGKTTLCAGVGLYCLHAENEPGAQIYAAAADREQAALLHNPARTMNDSNPELASRAQTYRHSITRGDSYFKTISSDANTKHGYNTHVALIDEVHAHKSRELIDVLDTSTGAREQPIIFYVTTADYMQPSICNEIYTRACKIRDGEITDKSFLPVIFEAGKEDDWTKVKTWKKANPNYGVSVSVDYFKRQFQKARDMPAFEFIFKRLHLNIRTDTVAKFLNMDSWRAAPRAYIEPGFELWGGLDMSSRQDLTAFVLAAPIGDLVALEAYFWIPEDTAETKERLDRVPYRAWEKAGHVRFCKGSQIDYAQVKRDILEICKSRNVREIAADPWNAGQLLQELEAAGIELVEFGQTMRDMSDPTKEFAARVAAGEIAHNDNPVLTWNAGNATVRGDENENIRPVKKQSTGRIDGIVAAIMALARTTRSEDNKSPYEDRGLLTW
ncbi:MAG: terminase large subunit [Burkholderiales bacterium]|nr:terminase large subunit [Burkholderiales bacterium]